MRAVVFGYHNNGAMGIRALLRHGFPVLKVYTGEDDPGEQIWFESVAGLCRERRLPFATPGNVNAPAVVAEVRELQPEIMFSFSYRQLLGPELLAIPPQGALNLHPSLLPRYRGRCPVNWVIIRGEWKTGISLHYMVAKPDAGDLVGQAEVWITKEDTARTLHDKLSRQGEELLDRLLPLIREGRAPRLPLDLSQGSYFGGRRPEDGRIEWNRSSWEIYNLIRGVTRPYPGAFADFLGDRVMVWWAVPDDSTGLLGPGELDVEDGKLFVGARFGALRLVEVEWRGKLLQGPELAREFEPHWKERFT